ncbi:hypothetical protein DPMN_150626 [Dreissena polymorpha]|uniref:Uncharacterized protein n=1 Tax=Dreissena polymorpha TaxID=45954 RepID=A0A9D4FI18_DREPO|nr:hypothetical protein DPMN_150626 [Dreissena polymorpha]
MEMLTLKEVVSVNIKLEHQSKHFFQRIPPMDIAAQEMRYPCMIASLMVNQYPKAI